MNARELMSDQVTTVPLNALWGETSKLMHELLLTQIPVLEENRFVGLLVMDDLPNKQQEGVRLTDWVPYFRKAAVLPTAHLFDIVKVALQYQCKAVAVVNEQKEFLGLISAEICLRHIGMLSSVQDSGGILELAIPVRDFSLTELSRIVEQEDVRILGLFTHLDAVHSRWHVTLKCNSLDLTSVVATLERHGYHISGVYQEENYTEDLKDRYDALMRFLNV